MKTWLAILVLSLTPIMAGCGPSQSTVPVPVSSATFTTNVATVQHADAPATSLKSNPVDNSLTTGEYMEQGMPSPDRSWSNSDMATVSRLITEISKRDSGQLPRFGSPKSGTVFARMTNKENLELFRNPTVPLEARLPLALQFMQAANGVNAAYLLGLVRQTTGDDEMTEITGLMLRVAVMMIELMDEFLPSLDKNDPTYPVRMDGMKKMKSGMANMMQGAIQQISEPGTWSREPLRRHIAYIDETFPVIIKSVSSGVRKETLVRLNSLSADKGFGDNLAAFREMLDKITAAANEASAAK